MQPKKIVREFVENFLEGVCTFTLFGAKWSWGKHKYSTFLRSGLVLTNAHVEWNPLSSADRVLLRYYSKSAGFYWRVTREEACAQSTSTGASSPAFVRDAEQYDSAKDEDIGPERNV